MAYPQRFARNMFVEKVYKRPQPKRADRRSNVYNTAKRKTNGRTYDVCCQPAPKILQRTMLANNNRKAVIWRYAKIRRLIKRDAKTYYKHPDGYSQQTNRHSAFRNLQHRKQIDKKLRYISFPSRGACQFCQDILS